jgi:phosphoribosylformylglycinamidine synthase
VGPSTPDGRHKLAQLVRCCQGLREACEAYGVPLVSGKDSMKNDAVLGGVKISIPPTLLVSAMGQLEDVARATSLQPRAVGEVIVLVGDTREELGGSELLRLLGSTHGSVPETDLTVTRRRYAAFAAQHAAGRVGAAHVVGRGGLAVALAHLALAGELGIDVILPAAGLPPVVELFAESTGRIVACVAEAEAAAFASAVEGRVIGRVAPARDDGGWLRVASAQGAAAFLDVSTAQLRTSYANEEGAT